MPDELGFIGVGIMGRGMIRNLMKLSGTKVVVWNRDRKKAEEALEGASHIEFVDTARAVTSRCAITFSMLSTPEAAKAVWEGEHGALAGLGKGHDIVDCATLTVEDMQRMAGEATAKGARFVEAPVSGSKAPAEQGQLIFLTAGDESLYKEVAEALDVMGKKKFFFGSVGKGTEMKLAVNMIMGTMLCSLGEGMELTRGAGISPEQLLEVLSLGVMNCPLFTLKGPAMVKAQKDPAAPLPPAFPLKHAQKDMAFAIGLGKKIGVELPVAAAANAKYEEGLKELGDEDFSAVIKRQAAQSS